ncbi:MAG: hypothetical protein AAFQ80_19270 [Cyanobacteria bacterium J06621_8]
MTSNTSNTPQKLLQKAINLTEQIYLKWMKLPPSALERIGRRTVEMTSSIEQFAQSRIVEQRLVQLNSIATRHQSPANKIVLKIVIIVTGAFTFTSAMRLFAASLGAIATPAALLGGMLVSLAVDFVATKASNNYVRRQYTRQTLNRLVKVKLKQENQLAYGFHESQEKLIFEIEGRCLSKEFPLNACLGGFLSTAEFVTAFWIVGEIGFLSGIPLPVRAIAAGLPVVLTWAAAYIQAQSFELPDSCAELIPEYESRIYPSPDMSPDEGEKWYVDRYQYIARLDAGIQNIIDETPHLEHPTPELTEIAFDIAYFQERAQDISQEKEQALIELENNFQQEIIYLEQEFPSEEVITQGRNWKDIELQKRIIVEARANWVKQEQPKREKLFQSRKAQVSTSYANAEQNLINQSTQSQQKYDRIYQSWLEKNRELNTPDLDNNDVDIDASSESQIPIQN